MSKVAVVRRGFVPQGKWAVFTIMRHDQTATIGTKSSTRDKGENSHDPTSPAFSWRARSVGFTPAIPFLSSGTGDVGWEIGKDFLTESRDCERLLERLGPTKDLSSRRILGSAVGAHTVM